jgi:hypothetical protein
LTKFALGYDFAKDYVFDMARKKVMKQTNGLYPAPLRILEVRRHQNILLLWSSPVLRIRDGYLPRIRIFSIPDPHQSILTQKMVSKLSEIQYDPGCSSRIRILELDPDFLPIPYPGSRGQKRHRIPDPDPQHWSAHKISNKNR